MHGPTQFNNQEALVKVRQLSPLAAASSHDNHGAKDDKTVPTMIITMP
jgi:hypothetical protein